MSNYEKVVEFNRVAGNVVNIAPTVVSKQDLLNRLRLIEEELCELRRAVETNDFVEMVDALVDIEYVTLGMASLLGFDFDKAFGAVHENNMSKFCKSRECAERSVAKFREQNTDADFRESHGRFVVFDKTTHKILKPDNYIPVQLSEYWQPKIESSI